MVYASLGRNQEAKETLDRAISLRLPRLLLQTLSLLKQECPVFFQQYALPLLTDESA